MRFVFPVLFLAIFPALHASDMVPVLVWSPAGADLTPMGEGTDELIDADGNRHFDHPCGSVMVREVNALPPPGDEEFVEGTETVYELNDQLEVIRSWSMPVDSWVMQVEGESIIVKYWRPATHANALSGENSRPALSITTSGELELLPESEPSESEPVDCPNAIARLFGKTAYGKCRVINDAETGEQRVILYQSPCT